MEQPQAMANPRSISSISHPAPLANHDASSGRCPPSKTGGTRPGGVYQERFLLPSRLSRQPGRRFNLGARARCTRDDG